MQYARKFSPKANEIKLKHEELTVAGISQMFMDCPSEDGKYDILVKLYGLMTIGSSIIFVKVRSLHTVWKQVMHLLTQYRNERLPAESRRL
jgi:superfamily II DNA/RNA helicase